MDSTKLRRGWPGHPGILMGVIPVAVMAFPVNPLTVTSLRPASVIDTSPRDAAESPGGRYAGNGYITVGRFMTNCALRPRPARRGRLCRHRI
jgi:hypothetical protein